MSVRKDKSGRWLAVVKWNGDYYSSRSFETKREGEAYKARTLALLRDGYDPKMARVKVEVLLPEWLAHREKTVAVKTFQADRSLVDWVPLTILRVGVGEVSSGAVADVLAALADKGRAKSSISRFRAMLSAFFAWAHSHKYIAQNPVKGVRVPSSARPPEEMRPYTRKELTARLAIWRSLDPEAAAQVEFLAATGLRWSEGRALIAADFRDDPYPAVLVSRAHPESGKIKGTKNGRSRLVPLPDDVAAWVASRVQNLGPDDDLLPVKWVGSLYRRLDWKQTSNGRSAHDLRHTAITQWLSDGVDMTTVRAWAGHGDLTTTSRYAHWQGSDADVAAIERVNRARAARSEHKNDRA